MADARGSYNKAWREANKHRVKEMNRRTYLKNREKNLEYAKRYREDHREETNAKKKKWDEENKEYRIAYRSEWYQKNRDKQIAYHKARTRAIRLEVLTHYGLFCSCCGEQDWEFLTIDHIEGGGNIHREELKVFGTNFYFWLKKNNFPSGYRTLCFNCNCAMGSLGYCPHQIGIGEFYHAQKVSELKLAALAKGVKK
jgi:hypothetical protein